MNSFEFNKIFAAFLCAGIVAMLGGFISEHLVHPHKLHKNAVEIDGGALAGAGPAKPKTPDPVLHLIASADVARGQKLSKACAACHSFDKGGANKVGPNLWNVAGSTKGAHAGFAYSNGMTEKGGKWGYDDLNKFLWKPKAYIKGTKMNYIGIKKPEDRAAMIAWLRTLNDSPMALPSAAQIAAEAAELAPPEEVVEEAAEAATEAAAETIAH